MTNVNELNAQELEALFWELYADELADALDGELDYPEDF